MEANLVSVALFIVGFIIGVVYLKEPIERLAEWIVARILGEDKDGE